MSSRQAGRGTTGAASRARRTRHARRLAVAHAAAPYSWPISRRRVAVDVVEPGWRGQAPRCSCRCCCRTREPPGMWRSTALASVALIDAIQQLAPMLRGVYQVAERCARRWTQGGGHPGREYLGRHPSERDRRRRRERDGRASRSRRPTSGDQPADRVRAPRRPRRAAPSVSEPASTPGSNDRKPSFEPRGSLACGVEVSACAWPNQRASSR